MVNNISFIHQSFQFWTKRVIILIVYSMYIHGVFDMYTPCIWLKYNVYMAQIHGVYDAYTNGYTLLSVVKQQKGLSHDSPY